MKPSSTEAAAKLFILQGGAEPLSSVAVWAEPSLLLLGYWLFETGLLCEQRVHPEGSPRCFAAPAVHGEQPARS